MVHNWVQYTGEGPEKANERTGRFLSMIAEPGKRIYFAEKFQNFDVAIDVGLPIDVEQFENAFLVDLLDNRQCAT